MTEAIFAKEKPIPIVANKKTTSFDEIEDENLLNDEDDEDLLLEEEKNTDEDEDEDFDEDKLTEESYRTTFDTNPEELEMQADEDGEDVDF